MNLPQCKDLSFEASMNMFRFNLEKCPNPPQENWKPTYTIRIHCTTLTMHLFPLSVMSFFYPYENPNSIYRVHGGVI